MSSGFIAVSVSLIGLTGVLFTLAIFIQMIVSFPDMLSSNSQAYVHQQRKTYIISRDQEPESLDLTVEAEAEWEDEQDQGRIENMVERWIELVDEATKDDSFEAGPTEKTQGGRQLASRGVEPRRGRSLGRQRRTAFAKPALDNQSDYDLDTEPKCSPAWQKSMKWTRQ